MNLADNLKKIRKDNNLSQEQLAERLGVSRQSVSKWESGLSYPEMDKVLQICKLFNLNINELINEDIKEVNELKEAQVRTNKYVTSFFDYITKVVDMFSSMKWKEKIKCLFEQCVNAIILVIIFAFIGMIGSEITWSLLQFFPDKVYYLIYNMLSSIYLVIAIIMSVVVLLHIFKIRYLDYYEIVKEEVDNNVEECVTELDNTNDKQNKILLEKKKEKVVIRDPKHSEYKFLTGLGKMCLWIVKAIVSCILCGFALCLVFFVLCIPIVFLIFKSGFLFIGLLVCLLGLIGFNIIVLELLYNFIVNRKLSKTRTFIISILSIILFGLGIGMSLMSLNSFEYLDEKDVEMVKDVYVVDMKDDLYLDFHFVTYVEKEIDDIEIEIEHSKYFDVDFYEHGNSISSWSYTSFDSTMTLIKKIIKDINNKMVIDYDDSYNVIVYASKENIEKLNNYKEKRDLEIANYERIIENQNMKYYELNSRYDDLIDCIDDKGYQIIFDSNGNIIGLEEIMSK
ncbi:MAG: helix-turn-helix domain-containing protein [Candidatus Coprovivens sp.]